ncbi:MAG: alkaline phosphatase family protein [Actinomycetota bacterium]
MGMRGRAIVAALVVLVSAASIVYATTQAPEDERSSSAAETLAADEAGRLGPIQRACRLPREHLRRINRGYHRVHSEDVTIVPKAPNYWGSFSIVSHSGPWNYLQRVPLVLYGPGYIVPQGATLDGSASLADVYPTIETLLDADFAARTGEALTEALAPVAVDPPKLIVTIMWDGVGRNVLERWPDRWPTLARLEREGTSYYDAMVGSSPSITPATHATLATGAYPKDHEVVNINYRGDNGEPRVIFENGNPRALKLTTFSDQWDRAKRNRPKVGLLAWKPWHMPMLGHGSQTRRGDKDVLGLIHVGGKVTGSDEFYRTPKYLRNKSYLLRRRADELDKEDGEADGEWLGHEIMGDREDNPAYVRYQGDLALRMLKKGGFGDDGVPDLFLANFKQTDLAGHVNTVDSQEMAQNLRAQDDQLGRLVDYLDESLSGDYVVILSADHGHTRAPSETGAWPVEPVEFKADIQRRFGVPASKKLYHSTSPVGPFLKRHLMKRYGITPHEIAEYLNGYTIRDNWPAGRRLPKGYRNRGDERILAAAWATDDLPKVLACSRNRDSSAE